MGLSNGWVCHSVQIALGVTCDMDALQLALTALLCLTKTSSAGEGEPLVGRQPERVGDEEAASRDVQDPLGLKQSVFIATPIVMVRKQSRKHDESCELRIGPIKNSSDSSSVINSPVPQAVFCGKARFCKTEYNWPHFKT